MYIVQLEEGVWLADGEGDPCRTNVKGNAKRFKAFKTAKWALSAARGFRLFASARIQEVAE